MALKQKYTLLTFYKFVDVKNSEKEVEEHLMFTKWIWMRWRIYIWSEWISSTVTWNEWQIMAYKLYLNNHKLFNNIEDIDIKSSEVDSHKFPKMRVKIRDEIVVLWQKYSKEEIEEAWNRMEVSEFKELLDNWDIDDYIVLDMRNDHEYRLWHFKNAIPASTLTFKELEDKLEEYKKEFWDKKIISYCTGWIRCEKSTVMMQKAWLKNTYQLDWWVVKYINTYNDWNWLGNLYVFDDRVSDNVWDKNTHTIIWECCYSWVKTDHCENCRYSPCNARLICTPEEYKRHSWFCSEECVKSAKLDFYIKKSNFDKLNYKLERAKIKVNPELKDSIFIKLDNNLMSTLRWIEFKNKLSLKEEYTIND